MVTKQGAEPEQCGTEFALQFLPDCTTRMNGGYDDGCNLAVIDTESLKRSSFTACIDRLAVMSGFLGGPYGVGNL